MPAGLWVWAVFAFLVAGMLAVDLLVDIPIWVSLAVVAGALALSVTVSVIVPPRPAEAAYSR